MKKLMLMAAIMTMAAFANGQGTVVFNTRYSSVLARVYDTDGVTPLNGLSGTYYAQLFAADGTDQAASTLKAKGNPVTFGTTSSAAGYVITTGTVNGTTVSTTVTLTSVAGGTVTVQMRAWDNVTDYATAIANYNAGTGKFGWSDPINITTTASITSTPVYLIGLKSFSLQTVPEPSTIALGVIGAAALLLRRRK
jgi:hypothetical protein